MLLIMTVDGSALMIAIVSGDDTRFATLESIVLLFLVYAACFLSTCRPKGLSFQAAERNKPCNRCRTRGMTSKFVTVYNALRRAIFCINLYMHVLRHTSRRQTINCGLLDSYSICTRRGLTC